MALSHGNIVQVFDMGRDSKPGGSENYFIAMEYVAGKNLRRLLRRKVERGGDPLEPAMAVWIASEILRGLDYAHRQTDRAGRPLGIVHRDLSPHNILVSYEGEVKVADFGIAKAANKVAQTETGLIRGKASYMSPEQAVGDPLDGRSDLFSVGILLYELLTGSPPWTGEHPQLVLKALTEGPLPPPPSAQRPAVSKDLDRLVMKALARFRDERYQTADAFQRDLGAYLVATTRVIGPRDLAALMQQLFGEEIATERTQITEVIAKSKAKPEISGPHPPRTLAPPATNLAAGQVPTLAFRTEPRLRIPRGARWLAAGGLALVALPLAAWGVWQATLPVATPVAVVTSTPPVSLAPSVAVPSPSAIASVHHTRVAVAATPVGTGVLNVQTTSLWGYVYLDGKAILQRDGQPASTPALNLSLSAGPHHLRVEQPGKDGMVLRGEKDLTVRPGETVTVSVTLTEVKQ